MEKLYKVVEYGEVIAEGLSLDWAKWMVEDIYNNTFDEDFCQVDYEEGDLYYVEE